MVVVILVLTLMVLLVEVMWWFLEYGNVGGHGCDVCGDGFDACDLAFVMVITSALIVSCAINTTTP